MDAARTSMIHAATPHFLWPFAVRYAAHQLNVSLPETSPTVRLTRKVGDASVFRVWGSRAFVRDTSAISSPPTPFPTSSLAIPLTRLAGSFTTPPRAMSCPLRMSRPPPVDSLSPQGPAPSRVTQVDPLPLNEPVEVIVDSGAATGAASGGAEPASLEPGGAEPASAEPGGAEPKGAESGGAKPEGVEPRGTEPEGAEPGGAESEGAESRGAEPRGTASAGGPAGASPRLSHRKEPL
ncbi:unnamed protein product [Closterium sp. NIES-53]